MFKRWRRRRTCRALNTFAPGAGQAAQTGIKLANRHIQYGGQVAGIMTQGALDTWLPMGAPLSQNTWFTCIAAGLADSHPALPNASHHQVRLPWWRRWFR